MAEIAIKKFNVQPYVNRAFCPTCDSELLATGLQLSSNPPQFHHRCNNKDCGFEAFFLVTYPELGYDYVKKPIKKKLKAVKKKAKGKK